MGKAYWEDIVVGDERVTPGRTVTETDVVNFAGISGSYDPEHVDAEFAAAAPFGQRIAHGLLTLAIAEGLRARVIWYNGDNLRSDTFIAFLGMNNLRYTKSVFFGDTLKCRTAVTGKRETKNPERGIVFFKDEVLNQKGEVVSEWERTIIMKRRPA